MYERTNFNTKKKLEDSLGAFGIRGKWESQEKDGAEDTYTFPAPDGEWKILWNPDCCRIIEGDPKKLSLSIVFDTIRMATKEEIADFRKKEKKETSSKICRWVAFLDSNNSGRFFIKTAEFSVIGEPTYAELYDTFNGKIPVNIMPHINTGLYSVEDKNRNTKIVSESLK